MENIKEEGVIMNQELQYLREELNQKLLVHSEQTNKAIKTILVIWSGAFTILGSGTAKFIETSLGNIPSYFLVATIFFISNLILYFTARQYYFCADDIFRLSSYIMVFYESLPGKGVKGGENFWWELANFKIMKDNSFKNKKSFFKKNGEYRIMLLISLVSIIILSVLSFISEVNCIIRIILSVIFVLYIYFSIYFLRVVPEYTSSKDNYGMKVQHLNSFFQYSLDTGHYTEDQIKDRFGDVYETCKRYL